MTTSRICKGEEYYGRNLNYLGSSVLICTKCGYIGTYDSIEEAEEAKILHDEMHRKEDTY